MIVLGIAITVVAVIIVMIVVGTLLTLTEGEPKIDEPLTADELVSTAVELDAIHQRLEITWCHHELRGEAHRLRRDLDAELRRIDALESGMPEE